MEETGEGRPKRVVDILAFGDSLTKGYSSRKYHPYSNKLLDLLEEHFPKHIIKIKQAGINGECVDDMQRRLNRLLEGKKATGGSFTHAIILGGTNDLGNPTRDGDLIFADLKALHEKALRHGACTIAVTIPEGGNTNSIYINRRKAANTLLKEWVSEKERVYLLDLEKAIPHLNVPEEEVDEMWDDNLHFSPTGYDKFGALLFETLKPTLSN